MNLDAIPDKYLHEMERLSKELLEVIRRARVVDQPLIESLRLLQSQAEKARRERFDGNNPEFRGY